MPARTPILLVAALLLAALPAFSQAEQTEPVPSQTLLNQRVSGGVSPAPSCKKKTFQSYRKWSSSWMFAKRIPRKAHQRHAKFVRCAVSEGHRKAMQQRWQKVLRSKLPANHDLWIRIGKCEQPGPGYKGIRWSHPGPTYQGGLGFWYGTWDSFKYRGMPDNAGDASWRDQMRVANRLLRKYGTSPWGCA